MAAKPERDRTLHRHRIQPGVVDVMPFTLELHQRLRPEAAEKLYLFFDSPAACVKVEVHCRIFDLVPANADAES